MAEYIYGSNNGDNNENKTPDEQTTSQESESGQAGTQEPIHDTGSTQNTGYGYQYNRYSPYQGGYGYQPIPPQPPKKRGPNTLIAVLAIVLTAVILATAAGIGGVYLMKNSEEGTDAPASDFGGGTDKNIQDVQNDPPLADVDLKPESLGTKEKGTIAEVVSKVSDSVVEIVTEYAQHNSFYYTQGAGSGVIIDEGGYIITNNHVINDDTYGTATSITVRLTNGESYDAVIVGADSDSDIAVLKIEADGLTKAPIGTSSTLVVGEEIVVIGNPLGTLGGSVTNGIISALDREITVENETMNLMQTNAAVNPGNSGGGMFNLAGELVGIVNAKYSESGIEGLGFAIPIDEAASVAEELMRYGYVKGRVSLHISVVEITTMEEMMRHHVNAMGLYIYEAEEGYNDDVLKNGDRIAQVDGIEVLTTADLKAILKGHSVGDKLSAFIVRGGSYIEVQLECFEKTTGDVQFDRDVSEE